MYMERCDCGVHCWVGPSCSLGSIYGLCLDGPRVLGSATPLGGLSLTAGWGLLLLGLESNGREHEPFGCGGVGAAYVIQGIRVSGSVVVIISHDAHDRVDGACGACTLLSHCMRVNTWCLRVCFYMRMHLLLFKSIKASRKTD